MTNYKHNHVKLFAKKTQFFLQKENVYHNHKTESEGEAKCN